jgi:hypothetical protein
MVGGAAIAGGAEAAAGGADVTAAERATDRLVRGSDVRFGAGETG